MKVAMPIKQHETCGNCGATVNVALDACDRCSANLKSLADAVVVFSEEAREAGQNLGGLLTLTRVRAEKVAFVGWCPGGAFGVGKDGRLIWSEDYGYLMSLEYRDEKLYFAGRETDPNTGGSCS
jgi:hypothetical protein